MKKLATSILIAMCDGVVQAQPIVDIGAFPNMADTTLEIRVRPHEDFGGVVSGLSFTLRWPVALGQGFLGTRVLTCPAGLPISPTPIVEDTGYYSRTFNGFGTSLLADEGCPWSACEEEMIMYLPAVSTIGLDQFEIVPDLYFISLGGTDYTGVPPPWGPCATGIEDTWSNAPLKGALVFPNPATDMITVTLPAGSPSVASVELVAADGRLIHLSSGQSGVWDIRSVTPGLYTVRVGNKHARLVKR